MLATKFHLGLLFLAVFLLGGFTTSSDAEVEALRIHLFGFVNNDDARQIRRLLSPWADAENISFHDAVDEHGRESSFTTVIEIIPRSERGYVKVYDIMRQLRDQRFRGSQAPSQPWVVKTEATVTGNLYAHAGWSRSYIRNVPFWRRWRGQTSAVNHALIAGSWEQKIVFSDNEEFDQLRQEAAQGDRAVEIKGQISGFDGPYPVMSVRKFRVEYLVEPRMQGKTSEESTGESEPSEEKSEDTDE